MVESLENTVGKLISGGIILLALAYGCGPRTHDDLRYLRQTELPADITDSRGRPLSRRGLQAYKTAEVSKIEREYTAVEEALANLPGVVSVRPGYGVVYVYTHRPAELPAEVEGTPVRAIPPELLNGVSDEWVTPEELPPLGGGRNFRPWEEK